MPVEGTIGWWDSQEKYEKPSAGRRTVFFRRNFKTTDGGETISNHLKRLILFIPIENIEVIE
jgi:hypothetical protein